MRIQVAKDILNTHISTIAMHGGLEMPDKMVFINRGEGTEMTFKGPVSSVS